MEGYLAHKWGLAANLPADHPHKEYPPGTPGVIVNLDGTVNDADGDPLTTTWSLVSTIPAGLTPPTIADSSAVDTTATFREVGVYILRLTADDGYGPVYDEVTITVGEPGALPEIHVNVTDAAASETQN